MDVTSLDALRQRHARPTERAVRRQIAALDVHSRRFRRCAPDL